ncbi:MAG TPA: beta-ketoacyl-ACP synthase III [Pirellulaceae bacterium]|jgi:3-oxoacyl-[acyl-carrier-protein] synthase-3
MDRKQRIARLTGVEIIACGSYAPPAVVTNADLAAHGYDADWIVQRTGILERRKAADDVAASDLAFEAAQCCLKSAAASQGRSYDEVLGDVDLIVLATMTPDSPIPSTACQLQRRLGCDAAAMDVGAACAGFMFALATGMQFVKTGNANSVLVVGTEVMTRTIDPADRKTFPLFGDGAGAVLLGTGNDEQGFLAYQIGADGRGTDLLCIPGGGSREPLTTAAIEAGRQFIKMDGRAVFKWAVNMLADSVRAVVAHAGLSMNDLALVILHQANRRILSAAADNLDIPADRLFINLDRYGNTSAASIPLALDEALAAGRIRRGDAILLSGFGAGLTWGTAVLRW